MSLDRNDVGQNPLHVGHSFAQGNVDGLVGCTAILKGGSIEKQ
jgi:hypothetical protein